MSRPVVRFTNGVWRVLAKAHRCHHKSCHVRRTINLSLNRLRLGVQVGRLSFILSLPAYTDITRDRESLVALKEGNMRIRVDK